MARRPREVQDGTPQHVMIRGNNRRRLFSYPSDYCAFLRMLADGCTATGARVHAVALMSNHVHLVCAVDGAAAMARLVKHAAQRYAVYRNRQRGGSGKLFEERYRTKAILSDEQLAVTTYYIEANPVRAGMVTDALDYPWTTAGHHMGRPERSKIPAQLWSPSPWFAQLAGANDADARAALYREVFAEYLARDARPDHVALCTATERRSQTRDGRRFERPDRTRIMEPGRPYGKVRGMPK